MGTCQVGVDVVLVTLGGGGALVRQWCLGGWMLARIAGLNRECGAVVDSGLPCHFELQAGCWRASVTEA